MEMENQIEKKIKFIGAARKIKQNKFQFYLNIFGHYIEYF